MKKVEHIGIAVRDLNSANELFHKLFGEKHYKIEKVDTEAVNTSFFKVGDTKIELLESTDPNGVISKFLEKRGEGVHHVAFEVDDIRAEVERMKAEGFEVINEEPHEGADNKLVCFLHPKSASGVLIELCQEKE